MPASDTRVIATTPAVTRLITWPRLPSLRKAAAVMGPGYLVAAGYMDPGNWATGIAAGSEFGYALLGVVIIASLTAVLVQYLALKLGIATGQNLAQVMHSVLPRPLAVASWLMAEVMIIACDLAEVVGTAIGLQLLFGLPLIVGLVITAADVLVLLALEKRGYKGLQALAIVLVGTVVVSFGLELLFVRPNMIQVLGGLAETPLILSHQAMMYLSVGIIGATIMPHNLYLHSHLSAQTQLASSLPAHRTLRLVAFDSMLALTIAAGVNCAILLLAAGFYTRGHRTVTDLFSASHLLSPLLGVGAAGTIFAIALLASGQNSTISATLTGQIIMEGFTGRQVPSWVRRLLTRCLAIVPAVIVVAAFGNASVNQLLIASQVILSLQLPFALWPLIFITSRSRYMGSLVNKRYTTITVVFVGLVISFINGWLIVQAVPR
jgi:manganese transport protein